MDFIKIILTACVCAFLGLVTLVSAVGLLASMLGPPPDAQRVLIVRILQLLCGVLTGMSGYLTYRCLLAVWNEITSPAKRHREVELITLPDLIRGAFQSRDLGSVDLSRITGAGWLLGIGSCVATGLLASLCFDFQEFQPGRDQRPQQKLITYLGFPVLVTIFCGGYWLLNQCGIAVVLPMKKKKGEKSRRQNIAVPRPNVDQDTF